MDEDEGQHHDDNLTCLQRMSPGPRCTAQVCQSHAAEIKGVLRRDRAIDDQSVQERVARAAVRRHAHDVTGSLTDVGHVCLSPA
ncbi:uncharacterized protein SPSK_00357 [Sporothrix schenckii 1099-18]|uniref:Uncharacterized protein n=1 Tax=Sporothrix schenckii 1099-18 TaxID=1397361 RepID=A0A0F2M5C6_SPOSC|nr:uncharacterized protein SPSK_00357 [Sporothrix schenckii 1099-18]KJR83980.1 hypothetical protein SPSK_00357 [Sporothrix schenckii 1099-18]